MFAITPLNDDLLIVPLGLIKYSPKKTIFFCWFGKLGLMLIFAYNLVNICGLIGGEDWLLSIASLYAIVIMVYVIVRFNIVAHIKKFAGKKVLTQIKNE